MGSKRDRRRARGTARTAPRTRTPDYNALRRNVVLSCMGHVPPATVAYTPVTPEDLPEIREAVYSGSPMHATVTCFCGVDSAAVWRDGPDATYEKITHAVHCRPVETASGGRP